jgi:hypothetical protein
MRARRLAKLLLPLLAATLGGTAGHLATSRRAAACSCYESEWRVERAEVTSSDPGSSHGASWPALATLTAYTGRASLWATDRRAGVVGRAEASR